MRPVPGGGLSNPPAAASPLAEDWGIALVLSLLPIVGLGLSVGDAVTLFGVALVVLVGARLPASGPLQAPMLRAGVCVLLALLCLLLPSAMAEGAGSVIPGRAMEGAVRLLLAGIVAVSLLRGRRFEGPRGSDRAAVGAGLAVLIVLTGLGYSGAAAAASALGGLAISLGLVFGVFRLHLSRCRTLPLLARTGAVGVFGAVLVVAIREAVR